MGGSQRGQSSRWWKISALGEGLLRCINSIFELLLTPDLGGVDYRNGSALQFGAPAERAQFRADNDRVPPVELHLLIKEGAADSTQTEDPSEPELNPIGDLLDAEKEARLIGVRSAAVAPGKVSDLGPQVGRDSTDRLGGHGHPLESPVKKGRELCQGVRATKRSPAVGPNGFL